VADEEFRTAYAAFVRSWIGEEFFAKGRTEEDFEDGVNQLMSREGSSITQILRSFHAKHGRYPRIEELCPPGGPVIGMLEDMK
jgi:hypothetical protein